MIRRVLWALKVSYNSKPPTSWSIRSQKIFQTPKEPWSEWSIHYVVSELHQFAALAPKIFFSCIVLHCLLNYHHLLIMRVLGTENCRKKFFFRSILAWALKNNAKRVLFDFRPQFSEICGSIFWDHEGVTSKKMHEPLCDSGVYSFFDSRSQLRSRDEGIAERQEGWVVRKRMGRLIRKLMTF